MYDELGMTNLLSAVRGLEQQVWYRIARIRRVRPKNGPSYNELDPRSVYELGPNLLPDFVAENRAEPFGPGIWIVGTFIPATAQPLPDWGSLIVRGSGSWMLRSTDGRQIYASGRRDSVFCLKGGES